MALVAKAVLVTVIAAFELEERLVHDLARMGGHGYTMNRVVGRGMQGPRLAGLADAPNMHIEIIASPALADRIFERITTKYAGQTIFAFRHEVEVIPREEFSSP